MDPEELNKIILHAVVKTSLHTWMGFWRNVLPEDMWYVRAHGNCGGNLQIRSTLQNTQWAESYRASFGRKQKGVGSASPYNPEKGRAGNQKKNCVSHPSDAPTGAKKTCMLYGPGHSSKECKVFKVYSKNHGAQRPFKDKEARSVGNKSTKTARFDDTTQEVNTVKYRDDRILKKKNGKK